MGWRKKVKITVVKKLSRSELFDEKIRNLVDSADNCQVVEETQEFIVGDDGLMPEGFCGSAWNDIYRKYRHLSLSGDFPWVKKKGTIVTCCTDGFRPVIFKLERIEDDEK